MKNADKPTVYYDGACPLCRREIAFYRRRRGADGICWIDVSRCPEDGVAPDLTKTKAMARFHVRGEDGTLMSGGAAFASLWAALPGFRALGRVFRLPPFAWTLDRAYRLFLHVRPRLQAMVSARQSPAATLPDCPRQKGPEG